jgi:Protein of unknown function (DUF2795)
MSDTSGNIRSETKSRNKKGHREPTSLHVDPNLWQEVRVMAVLKGVSVTEYFEDALRRKIDADNREAGKGYRVGQGGMYIPPPPQLQQQPGQEKRTQSGENPPNRMADRLTEWAEELGELDAMVEKYRAGGKVTLHISSLGFPANKNKIIEAARKNRSNIAPAIEALDKIPDREYKNEKDLSNTFLKTYRKLVEDIIAKSMDKLGDIDSSRFQQLKKKPYIDSTLEVSVK